MDVDIDVEPVISRDLGRVADLGADIEPMGVRLVNPWDAATNP